MLFTTFILVLMTVLPKFGLGARIPLDQQVITSPPTPSGVKSEHNDSLKVPGYSEAYHCSDPSNDLFQFSGLMFNPIHPQEGFIEYISMWGNFTAATGDNPWLIITANIDGRDELAPVYDWPLCGLNVWQEMLVPNVIGDRKDYFGMSRASPAIEEGYTEIDSPAMPLYPGMNLAGEWTVRAEATTQKGERIFCVEGTFNVTEYNRGDPPEMTGTKVY